MHCAYRRPTPQTDARQQKKLSQDGLRARHRRQEYPKSLVLPRPARDTSGQVPAQLRNGLAEAGTRITHGRELSTIDLWAVHPGGRSILDAVEKGLALPAEALSFSRSVLAQYGNMSSATVMFVLHEIMRHAQSDQRGCAMSFGPGLTAETMLFHAA